MSEATPAAIAASRAPLSRADFDDVVGPGRPLSRLDIVATSPSTNTALLGYVTSRPDGWGHLSGYVADHQTAGRGRAGRSWATPDRAALTGSYVLRPAVSRSDYGWAPLVVGLATVRALRRMGVGAFLKWPNDVVVEHGARDIPEWGRWRKVVGILCETVPGQDAIVAGIGINVSQDAAELPVPHAASLATLGASSLDRVALLRALAAELRDAVAAWERGDDIPAMVTDACATLGWEVAVDVPAGSPVNGTAIALTASGGLLVRTANGDQEVLAGDVRVRRSSTQGARVREPAPSIERIGSARRAWVSVRNTTAIFAPLWILSLFLGPEADNGDWADLTWVALGSIYYAVAIVVVLPVFAFTLGRWIDKRTWRSTRKAVLTFGYYGLAWGVVAVGLYGFGGNASGGLLLWLLIPGIAAAVARLLLDVRSVSWTIISWVFYVLAMLPVLYVLLIQLTGGFNLEV